MFTVDLVLFESSESRKLILSNLLLVSFAFNYTVLVSIEKICQSILAQIIIRNDRLAGRNHRSDLMTKCWFRMINKNFISASENSVKLFNVLDITFRRIIELNFVLLSLDSLMHKG